MNAVRAGLVQDGFSWAFVLVVVLAAVLGWLSVRLFHVREQRETETPVAEVNPECCLDTCHELGWPQPSSVPGGVLFVCRAHTYQVSLWTGEQPYDQEAES